LKPWVAVGALVAAAVVAALAASGVLAVGAGRGAPGASLATRVLVPADVRALTQAEARLGARGRARTAVEAALQSVGGRASVRSSALTLAALLTLEDAAGVRGPRAQALVTQATELLRTAVQLDPRNGVAAHDLELLLTKSSNGGSAGRGRASGHGNGSTGAGSRRIAPGY
jgi:hypothetical protein